MAESMIKINKTGKVGSEFASKADKRKAYKVFLLTTIFAIALTGLQYLVYDYVN